MYDFERTTSDQLVAIGGPCYPLVRGDLMELVEESRM